MLTRLEKTQAFKCEPWRQLPRTQRHTEVTAHESHKRLLIILLMWDVSTRKLVRGRQNRVVIEHRAPAHPGEVPAFGMNRSLR